MKLKRYLSDRLFEIIMSAVILSIIIMLFRAFHSEIALMITVSALFIMNVIAYFIRDFCQKKRFYDAFLLNIDRLDKKYLVIETIDEPDFYEGELCFQAFYEINKSMIENVKTYEKSTHEFKDYIEMWVHEVKIPIASLLLMCHNNRNSIERKYVEQIRKLDNYTDQILYYVRGENAEQDYLIKETALSSIIRKAAMKNKDDILENHMELRVEDVDRTVLTDSKWLEFIINQLVNNSIKYRRTHVQSYIAIFSRENAEQVEIIVEDNGMGIPEGDLPNLYKKTFTGENGRIHAKSTGMGLYIVKNLIDRLGHKIEITSKQGAYTRVKIRIAKNDFYRFS